jgi:hypothetical protein
MLDATLEEIEHHAWKLGKLCSKLQKQIDSLNSVGVGTASFDAYTAIIRRVDRQCERKSGTK